MSRTVDQLSVFEFRTILNRLCSKVVDAGFRSCKLSIIVNTDYFEIQWTIISLSHNNIFRYKRRCKFDLCETDLDKCIDVLTLQIIENPVNENGGIIYLAV